MYFCHLTAQKPAPNQPCDLNDHHHTVWGFFPLDPDSPRHFLFRHERIDDQDQYWVLSDRPPLTRLPGWTTRVQPYQPQPQAGDCFRFSLRANPVCAVAGKRHDMVKHRRHTDPASRHKQLHELVQIEGGRWLNQRADRHGFSIQDGLSARDYHVHRFFKGKRRGGRPVCLSTMELSGTLRVTHPEAFQHSLLTGIGHAKGYGCGLLMLHPST